MATSDSPKSIAATRTLQVAKAAAPATGSAQITISGTGFGTRTAAYNHYINYNDVADGTAHPALGYVESNSSVYPTVESNDSHDGGKSLEGFYPAVGNFFPKLRRNFTPIEQIYGAFWFKWTPPAQGAPVTDVGIFKLFRTGFTNYNGYPRAVETIRSSGSGVQTSSDTGVFRDDATNSYDFVGNSDYLKDAGQWHFCEYFFKLSTPGQPDGVWAGWTNGKPSFFDFAAITRFQSDSRINFFINMFDGRDRDAFDMTVYQSEEYVSSARARVIITDNADYSLSTTWQIQPVVSWSDSSIVVARQQGALSLGTNYAHIFNESDQLVDSQAVEFN
jgi:hypothetical protein